jgi:hypothetical protein
LWTSALNVPQTFAPGALMAVTCVHVGARHSAADVSINFRSATVRVPVGAPWRALCEVTPEAWQVLAARLVTGWALTAVLAVPAAAPAMSTPRASSRFRTTTSPPGTTLARMCRIARG